MNLKTKIYLSNDILSNKNLSTYDFCTYVALRAIFFDGRKDYFVNTDIISYELYSDISISRKTKDAIKQSICNLENLSLIKIIKDFGRGNFLLDLENIYLNGKNEFYTTIDKQELTTIMNINCKEDNFKMLRYFITLIKSINSLEVVDDKRYVGFMSMNYLSEEAGGLSKTSITKYNSILEENKLIYAYHHEDSALLGTEIKSIPNHYGRYEDKKLIEKYAKKMERYYKKNGHKCGNQDN